MQITIKAEPKSVEQERFSYSNTDSSYSVNTQYFTKNGKPFTIISGEVHFSRLPICPWRGTLITTTLLYEETYYGSRIQKTA